MKKALFIAFLSLSMTVFGQETSKEKIKKLTNQIETTVIQEKGRLKIEIEAIDKQIAARELSTEQANDLKREKSEASAKRIEAIVTKLTDEINVLTQQIVQNALEGVVEKDTTEAKGSNVEISISKSNQSNAKRTANRFTLAFGLNNVLQDNKLSSLDDSPYNLWRSNFVEMGWGYKTAFDKESNLLNVFYGVSLQWNELKLTDNSYHVDVDGETLIVTHPENLKKAKLRNTQIIVPLGLEFDFSKKEMKDGKTYFHRNQNVRFGIGGYAGLRVNTKQIIKYEKPRDVKKEKITADYNTNNLTYGLMSYLGYKDASLYVKYDLHPLFKDTETTNISLGIRWDL